MRSQGMTAKQLADKINLTPQAVYDIFKKNHIATDRLMEVQRVLGRDFFKELSQLVQHGGVLAGEEDENAVQERFEMLMPEDKLHVIGYKALSELAEEFVMTEHHKPLVIFYTNEWEARSVIGNIADMMLGVGKVYYLDWQKEHKQGKTNEELIQLVASMPHPIVNAYNSQSDEYFRFIVDLAQATGKKVFAYIKINQEITNYKTYTEYRDTAMEPFGAWREHVHFALVDDERKSYRQTRQLFLANHSDDILNYIQRSLLKVENTLNYGFALKWLNNPALLYSAYREWFDRYAAETSRLKEFRNMYLDDELDIKQEGSRWILSLPVDDATVHIYKDKLTNERPQLSMWIDVRDNHICDFQNSGVQMSIGNIV